MVFAAGTLHGAGFPGAGCAIAVSGARLGAAGGAAALALDFIDGDATPNNQLSAGSFNSDGTTSLLARTGSVSGSTAAGLVFDDSAFFSEALLGLGGANSFDFVFNATGIAPAAGGFADAFSVILLGTGTGVSLIETDDPTGANALFQWLALNWGVVPADAVGGTVPEPASVLLVASALALLLLPRLRAVALAASLLLSLGLAQAEDLTSSVAGSERRGRRRRRACPHGRLPPCRLPGAGATGGAAVEPVAAGGGGEARRHGAEHRLALQRPGRWQRQHRAARRAGRHLNLSGNTALAGTVYTGSGSAAINKNSLVLLTLRGPEDVLNNVPPLVVQPLPAAPSPGLVGLGGLAAPGTPERAIFNDRETQARERLHAQRGGVPRLLPVPLPQAEPTSVTVSATGGARDVLAQGSAQLVV